MEIDACRPLEGQITVRIKGLGRLDDATRQAGDVRDVILIVCWRC